MCAGVPIARTGEMEYGPGESPIEPGPDGKAIVYREAREVFRPETIASFEGKPFTIKHPEDFVNPGNWKVLAKGIIQNVRRGTGETENDLIADILITDHEAILLVKGGVREVSCGYEAEYIQLGVGRGMQTNIIGNHLALVEQGRAGAAYAINDEKGAKMSKWKEKTKTAVGALFGKAKDEAFKVIDEAVEETPATPAKKTGDEMPVWAKAMQKTIDALAAQMPSSGTPGTYTDEEVEAKKKADDEAAEKEKADDEAPKWAKDLKASMDSFMEKMNKSEDGDDDEEESESEDAEEGEEESEDDDFEETPASKKTGDDASRIEILAPGLKAKGKDAKRTALAKAYESKDNKAIIDRLNGGKVLDIKKASQKTIDHIFVGASEVIGLYRTKDFTKWKQVRDSGSQGGDEFAGAEMTPEMINEKNKQFYATKGAH